jgi:small nuclear ribonucleoprotein (snRNP)-like protein
MESLINEMYIGKPIYVDANTKERFYGTVKSCDNGLLVLDNDETPIYIDISKVTYITGDY